MIRKSVQYEQAKELRKRGFTYEEIAKIVDVSKSTVSTWFSHETWSTVIALDNKNRAGKENSKRISLLNTARANQMKKQKIASEQSAVTEFKHYKQNPLFVAGIMIYGSIGDRSLDGPIRITSTQKEIHALFMRFLQEYLGVSKEKLRFWLVLYPDHIPVSVSQKWSRTLHFPVARFHKYQIIEKKSNKQTLHDGVGNTIIGGTILKQKLLKWVELASKEY